MVPDREREVGGRDRSHTIALLQTEATTFLDWDFKHRVRQGPKPFMIILQFSMAST